MIVQIKKWGNSLAVRIPAKALSISGLGEGSWLEVNSLKGEILLKESKPKVKYTLEQMFDGYDENSFEPNQEDREWMNDGPVGGEKI
ncbi:AbrB/MazE/SpoVT family DNA-binding domain-containing protein [Endozoicomonas sp. 2B-B]